MHVLRLLLACTLLTGPLLASDPPPAPKPPPSPDLVLKGVQSFLALTARPDGSFRPGIDPEYEGMADSAFSDLAPAAYAVVLSKTFGLKLPYEENTRLFFRSRQRPDGAFVNVGGTADPKSAA